MLPRIFGAFISFAIIMAGAGAVMTYLREDALNMPNRWVEHLQAERYDEASKLLSSLYVFTLGSGGVNELMRRSVWQEAMRFKFISQETTSDKDSSELTAIKGYYILSSSEIHQVLFLCIKEEGDWRILLIKPYHDPEEDYFPISTEHFAPNTR